MSELHKIWLEQLYREAIEESIGTIANEKIWMLGEDGEEVIAMHEEFVEELDSYIELLKDMIADLNLGE